MVNNAASGYYKTMDDNHDKLAKRAADEIDSGSVLGEQILRVLGVHPNDIKRRKEQQRMIIVAVAGVLIVSALIWFV